VLPLPDKRLWDYDQKATLPLCSKLREHEAGLDRLAEANLVSQNAAAFRDATERKHDGVDLMWVRIDAPLPLRRRRPGLLIGAALAD